MLIKDKKTRKLLATVIFLWRNGKKRDGKRGKGGRISLNIIHHPMAHNVKDCEEHYAMKDPLTTPGQTASPLDMHRYIGRYVTHKMLLLCLLYWNQDTKDEKLVVGVLFSVNWTSPKGKKTRKKNTKKHTPEKQAKYIPLYGWALGLALTGRWSANSRSCSAWTRACSWRFSADSFIRFCLWRRADTKSGRRFIRASYSNSPKEKGEMSSTKNKTA